MNDVESMDAVAEAMRDMACATTALTAAIEVIAPFIIEAAPEPNQS